MPIAKGKNFLSRCISEMSHKHPDWDNKRVVAACYSMQRQQGDSGEVVVVDGWQRGLVMDEQVTFDDDANVRITNDGYLVAMPRIARSGIQVYAGHEVCRPDLDRVRVYRPPEEVFHADAMLSLIHI